MRTLRGILVRLSVLAVVIIVGLLILLAMGGQEGAARTNLDGMKVTALSAASDAVLYANVNDSTLSGVFRSTDGGETWQLASRQLNKQVSALAVSPAEPRVIYAGTPGGSLALGEESLYMSTDGGRRWSRTPVLLPARADGTVPSVLALAVDPADAGTVYVGTDGQGVYKLTDMGTTLTAMGDELYGARVDRLVVDPQDSRRVYAVTSKGLFRSDSAGESWSKVASLPEQAVSVAVAPSDNRVVYVGTASMGAYRSVDGGETWQAIGEGLGLVPGVALSVDSIEVDAENPYLIYATPSYVLGATHARRQPLGVFVSMDGGDTWKQVSDAAATGSVNTLVRVPQQAGEVYLATDRGVFLADPMGAGEVKNRVPTQRTVFVNEEGQVAFSRVLVILVTLVAASAVLIVNPVQVCRTLFGRYVRSCDL